MTLGIDAPTSVHHALSRDGTRITYRRIGRGPRRWLMPPAMGAPVLTMKHLLEYFQDDYTVVTWDMRGFQDSGMPRRRDAFGVEHHVEDMLAVRAAEGLSRVVVGGWSMGVQLSLEYYRLHPDDVLALVLINGPFEHVLDSVVPLRGAGHVTSLAVSAGRRLAPVLNRLGPKLAERPTTAETMVKSGLVARDSALFRAALAEFTKNDWGPYFRVMQGLHHHSAADVLARITVPTLVTAGGRDRMTPVTVAKEMVRRIPGSELFVMPEGTHYSVIEFPELLNPRIAAFLGSLPPRHDNRDRMAHTSRRDTDS